jgi:hypothetical protein
MKPSVFVGSASEDLGVVQRVAKSLESVADVTVWTQGVFDLGDTTIESLHRALDGKDFAIFVVSGNDVVISRKQRSSAPRDNVLFEMGLFSGRLGRNRVVVLMDRTGASSLKLPSDLNGITFATFDDDKRGSVTRACAGIKQHFEKVGPMGPRFAGPTFGLVGVSAGHGRREAFEGIRQKAQREVIIVGAAMVNLAAWQLKSLKATAARVPVEVMMMDPDALASEPGRAVLFEQFFDIRDFASRVRASFDQLVSDFTKWNQSGETKPVTLRTYSTLPTMSMVMRDSPSTLYPHDGEAVVEFFLYQCGTDRPRIHVLNDGDSDHLFLRILRECESLRKHSKTVVAP